MALGAEETPRTRNGRDLPVSYQSSYNEIHSDRSSSPANPSHIAIKRVVGLPGDRITTREPCMKSSQIVPFNHVWLEGDAKDPKRSLDSNTYGPVSLSLITGRVVAVLWPRWRWLQWSDWEKGVVEGDVDGRFGKDYRADVRQRVLKEAVKIERPVFE